MTSFGENIPQNPPKGGVNRQFPAKSQNFKLRHYQNYSTDLIQILHSDKDQQCHFAGVLAHAYKNPIWRTAAILEIEKLQ